MNRTFTMLTVALLCCLGWATQAAWFATRAAAQDNKGPNIQESPKEVKETEKTKALQDLELAARLIRHGRQKKNAESLLLAAQILHQTPTVKLKVGYTVTGEKTADAPAPAKLDNSPKALIAEAVKLSGSPHVKSLADATQKIIDEETRGALGGPQTDGFMIRPGQTINWNPITFVGLQKAVVHVENGAPGRMILEVRDQFGNVVARDTVPGSFFRVEWYPAFTGAFRIRLVNLDSISFNCGLATN